MVFRKSSVIFVYGQNSSAFFEKNNEFGGRFAGRAQKSA